MEKMISIPYVGEIIRYQPSLESKFIKGEIIDIKNIESPRPSIMVKTGEGELVRVNRMPYYHDGDTTGEFKVSAKDMLHTLINIHRLNRVNYADIYAAFEKNYGRWVERNSWHKVIDEIDNEELIWKIIWDLPTSCPRFIPVNRGYCCCLANTCYKCNMYYAYLYNITRKYGQHKYSKVVNMIKLNEEASQMIKKIVRGGEHDECIGQN